MTATPIRDLACGLSKSITLWCAAPFLDGFAEVGQQLFDVPAGAAVPFDLMVPATLGGVASEGLPDLTSGPQPWGVVGCAESASVPLPSWPVRPAPQLRTAGLPSAAEVWGPAASTATVATRTERCRSTRRGDRFMSAFREEQRAGPACRRLRASGATKAPPTAGGYATSCPRTSWTR